MMTAHGLVDGTLDGVELAGGLVRAVRGSVVGGHCV